MRKSYLFILLLSIVLTITLLVLFIVNPDKMAHGEYPIPACPTIALFGFECPGCGMGRGLAMVANGRFEEARDYNKMSMLFFMLISFANLLCVIYLVRDFIAKRVEVSEER